MHIGFLIGSDSWGGLEMNQLKSANWMKTQDVKISVLAVHNPRIEAFCLENDIPLIPIKQHKKYYDFKASKALREIIRLHEIHHLIIRDVRDMSTAALAKYWSGKTFRLHYFMEMQLGVNKKNPLHTLRFSQLDTWSCPLLWLQEQVKTKTKIASRKLIHIPSPIDLNPFQNSISKATARKQLELPESAFLIGLAGRFDPQKGQLLLLEALKQNPHHEIQVVFLGEPTAHEGETYYQAMQALIQLPALKNRVYIRPFRQDIEVFYKAIDVFVMASKAETVGMVTLEALASGCSVIGSNAGGTPEILGHGTRGYLFHPLDSASLSEQLSNAFGAPKQLDWDEIGAYLENFNYKRVMPQVKKRLDYFT